MTAFILSSIFVTGLQQTPIKRKATAEALVHDTRPVTCEEAAKVFGDARKILSHVLHASLGKPSIPSGSSPVTREQVVGEMASITGALGPKIKFTPKLQAYSPSVFTIKPSQSANLNMLVKLGYVGRVGYLATSPNDTLSLHQFGDALGFYLARTAELTHMPSTRWSPVIDAN